MAEVRPRRLLRDGATAENRALTQADLARAAKVSRPTVNGWVSGKIKNLRGKNLTKLAELLDVNHAWLADGVGPKRTEIADAPKPIEPQQKLPENPIAPSWPFELISRAEFDTLPDRVKGEIDRATLEIIRAWKARSR